MEFVEYYRIIRRRIWIAVVLAALAAAIVVVARLLPAEVEYPATGRMLVHETAQRQIRLTDNQAIIGIPEDARQFWQDLDQFMASRFVLQAAAEEMGIAPQEADEQLQPARAERIGDSSAIMVYASASGVPDTTFDPNVSNARDMAVRYCDAVMVSLDDVWRARRIAELQQVRLTLEQREPTLRQEISQIQRRGDSVAADYSGAAPPGVLQSLTAELALVEQQIASGEVERGTAEARAQAISNQAGELESAAPMPTAPPAVDPRVQSLQQAILERQIALDEQLTRRTEEHEEVQALMATIERMQERLAALRESVGAEGGAAGQSPGSLMLAQTAINANVESAAAARRLELLQQRANNIRSRLPDVRADARLFEDVSTRLDSAQTSYENLLDSLERLDAEEQLIAEATLFEVLSEAEPGTVPRGLAGFMLRLLGAIIGGAALGILLIFALHYVDFSFQDEQEAERMLGVPVLAGIPRSDVEMGVQPEAPEETHEQGGEQQTDSDDGIF